MSDAHEAHHSGCMVAAVHWAVWIMLYPVALVVVSLFAVVWMAIAFSGDPSLVAGDADAIVGPGFLGATAVVQIGLLGLGAVAMSSLLPTEPGRLMSLDGGLAKVVDAHALTMPAFIWLSAAALGAVTVGWLPGWVGNRILEHEMFEGSMLVESFAQLGAALADMTQPGWWVLVFAVVVVAPLCEEVIFRGFLWKAAENAVPPVAVWLLTSFIFAGYHLNPIHMLTVLPIGLFLGWLRWMSGSIWPGILAHFLNNAMAVVMTVWMGVEADVPFLPAAAAFLFTALVCVAAAGWTRMRAPAMVET